MSEQNELEELVADVDVHEAKERRALTMLLDKYSQPKGKVFAIRSEMGYTLEETGQRVRIPSFSVIQSLDWVGKEIKMGSQMPFMQNHIDEKGRLVVDDSIAESVKQRAPDWTRQAAITAYLAHDKRRKFGTIIAVLNPPWVDDTKHDNWAGADGKRRAIKSAYKFQALDSKGRIGLLDLEDTLIYALDGQHRVMGIRGIQELRDNGSLTLKNRDGQSKGGEAIKKEQFMEQFNLDIAELQSLLDETISVELIPAAIAGETRDQASQRVRSVFITINAYAQRTGKGETALLDESDGFAIIGRKAGTLHPLFSDDRVNWKTSTLPKRTRWYTTLDTLKEMAKVYLLEVANSLTKAWEPYFHKQVPIRPDEGSIEKGKEIFSEFLDRVRELPVFKGLESGDNLDAVRGFPGEEAEEAEPKGHLLTRPVGQMILAQAVGTLVHEGMKLTDIFKKLAKWDRLGGFSQHNPKSIWYGVTYDFVKSNMNTRTNINMAARLLAYMVRGGSEDERKELLAFIVESRRSGGTAEKPKWTTFDEKQEAYDPEEPWTGKHMPLPIDRLSERSR